VDSRTLRLENRQQGHGPDEERKHHALAGHVDVVRGLDRSEWRAPELSIDV
jgi:acetylornithine deacetylase/succinyl-diaminopimelate desuccinylase-like protein